MTRGSDHSAVRGESPSIPSALADPRKRQILSILRKQSQPISERELAQRVVTRRKQESSSDTSELEYREIRADLYHRCLPQLEADGWIDRRSDGVVASGRAPVEAGTLLTERGAVLPWELLAVLSARPFRWSILGVLLDQRGTLELETLASSLVDRHGRSRISAGNVDERMLRVALHHVDLPRLDDVGLVEYDHDGGFVTPTARFDALEPILETLLRHSEQLFDPLLEVDRC